MHSQNLTLQISFRWRTKFCLICSKDSFENPLLLNKDLYDQHWTVGTKSIKHLIFVQGMRCLFANSFFQNYSSNFTCMSVFKRDILVLVQTLSTVSHATSPSPQFFSLSRLLAHATSNNGMLTIFLVCWLYFWYIDCISGILTIFLVCWQYFWYADHISGMLILFLVCWP